MHCINRLWAALFTLVILPVCAAAQQPVPVDSLRQGIEILGARLDSLEAGRCSAAPLTMPEVAPTGDPATDSLGVSLHRLADRVRVFEEARCGMAGPVPADTLQDDLAALRDAAARAADVGDEVPPADTTSDDPGFVSLQQNLNRYNPEISATGDIRLIARDEETQRDNAEAHEFEIALQSNLDPYSTAKIFVGFAEDEIAIEEGYLYYTGLPGNVRLDLGKFRQEVGDLNRWHLHALPQSEYPLVYQKYLSPEGLAGVGLSLYTVLPVSLLGGTHEAWLQGTTASGLDPLLAGSTQPLGLARIKNFWQLNPGTYAQVGFTGMLGENSDSSMSSNLTGADFRLTWRPPNAGTRRDVTLRLEGYRLHANVAGTVTNRYGMFADLEFKFSRRWTVGTRYDYVEAARDSYADEWRITPALTWWQSEFVYLRLQAQHRRELDGTNANEIMLQAVFAMGP
ncbi:MAG: hypothetical protein ACREL6_02760, partial [Gemmatimonadales bacterium]